MLKTVIHKLYITFATASLVLSLFSFSPSNSNLQLPVQTGCQTEWVSVKQDIPDQQLRLTAFTKSLSHTKALDIAVQQCFARFHLRQQVHELLKKQSLTIRTFQLAYFNHLSRVQFDTATADQDPDRLIG